MEKLTKCRLEDLLTKRLSLDDPHFYLESAGRRLVGNVVSPSFKGKRDHERQKMIWDALEAELGEKSVILVGMLLAYTPEEWQLGADDTETSPKRKKVG